MLNWRNAIRDTCQSILCTVFRVNILSKHRSCSRHSTAAAAVKRLHLMIMKCNKIPIRIVRLLLPIFSRKVKNHAMRSLQRNKKNRIEEKKKNLQKPKQSNGRRKKHFHSIFVFLSFCCFQCQSHNTLGKFMLFTYSKTTTRRERRRKIYAVSFYCSRTVTSVNLLCIQAHIVVCICMRSLIEHVYLCISVFVRACMCVRDDDDGYFNDALSVAIYFYFTAFTHVSGL